MAIFEAATARTADDLIEVDEAEEAAKAKVVDALAKLAREVGAGNVVRSVEDVDRENDKLRKTVDQMREDWRSLNRFMNATAAHYSWCSSWEDRISRYNGSFGLLKLVGRERYPRRGERTHDGDPYDLGDTALSALALCEACRAIETDGNRNHPLMQMRYGVRSDINTAIQRESNERFAETQRLRQADIERARQIDTLTMERDQARIERRRVTEERDDLLVRLEREREARRQAERKLADIEAGTAENGPEFEGGGMAPRGHDQNSRDHVSGCRICEESGDS